MNNPGDSNFVETVQHRRFAEFRSLRAIKEQRQVIIVTHNANIVVLGDAELAPFGKSNI
jgi:hypothetical protein